MVLRVSILIFLKPMDPEKRSTSVLNQCLHAVVQLTTVTSRSWCCWLLCCSLWLNSCIRCLMLLSSLRLSCSRISATFKRLLMARITSLRFCSSSSDRDHVYIICDRLAVLSEPNMIKKKKSENPQSERNKSSLATSSHLRYLFLYVL